MKGAYYVIGKRRKLTNGSIVLRGDLWIAVAVAYVVLMVLLRVMTAKLLPHELQATGFLTALGLFVLVTWKRPGRAILFDAAGRRLRSQYYGLLPVGGEKIDMPFAEIREVEILHRRSMGRMLVLHRHDGTAVVLGTVSRLHDNRNLLSELRAIIAPA